MDYKSLILHAHRMTEQMKPAVFHFQMQSYAADQAKSQQAELERLGSEISEEIEKFKNEKELFDYFKEVYDHYKAQTVEQRQLLAFSKESSENLLGDAAFALESEIELAKDRNTKEFALKYGKDIKDINDEIERIEEKMLKLKEKM